MAFPHLNLVTVISSFPIVFIGKIPRPTATAVETDHIVKSAEQFVKRIVHGEKLSYMPGVLLFTAPYKLCEGGCNDTVDNFAMAFPLYVGTKGIQRYKDLYSRDFINIHSSAPNAPFKERTTRHPFTLCPTTTTTTIPVITTTEATTMTETEASETTLMTSVTDKSTENKLLTLSETSPEVYITNANGVRCPIPIKPFCKKTTQERVTGEIVTLKIHSADYNINDEQSNSFDYNTNEEEFRAIHERYFDKRLIPNTN